MSAPESNAPWSRTPQGRRELLAVGIFCLLNITLPLFITDLYPFSRAPMFADSPRHYCDYQLSGPDGQPLDLKTFGLQRNYWGNPLGFGVGYYPPPSLDIFGTIATEKEVIDHLQRRLAGHPELKYIDVTQCIFGDVSGAMREQEQHRWRVYPDDFKRLDRQ